MKSPVLYLFIFWLVCTNTIVAQPAALPNQEIHYTESHSYVDHDIEYEVINYSSYSFDPNDTIMTLYRGAEVVGDLHGNATQVWYRRTGPGSPAYSGFSFQQNEWYLLYDYGLLPGDTAYTDQAGISAVIDSITFTDAYAYMGDPFPLKVFHLSNDDIVIEKIGSLEGFFRPYTYIFEHGSALCSFEGWYDEPDYLFVDYSGSQLCYDASGLSEIGNHAAIYPNPFEDALTITAEKQISQTVLSDGSGRNVRETTTAGQTATIYAADLAPGMYILKILFEDGTVLQKSCVHK